MSLRSLKKWFISVLLFACTHVFAAPLVVNVAGIQSNGQLGDPANTVFTFNVGANATISSLDYLVNVAAFRTSWLSELTLCFSDATQTRRLFFHPGYLDETPGTGTYADSLSLVDLGLAFNVGADGILRLEFFEGFDDFAGADGVWNFGTITFGVEPVAGTVAEPGTGLLMGAGLGIVALASRRRRSAA